MARRSNGEGSFYQQKDKSWVYQVTYGRKEDGSPYRKAFKGRTKTICKERRAQWEEEQARICVSRMTSSMKTCISDGLRTRISGVITSGLVVSTVGLHGSWYFLMAYAKKSFSSICWF